jgi:hypothetical protein
MKFSIKNISFLRCDFVSFLYFMTSFVFPFIVQGLQLVLNLKLITAIPIAQRFIYTHLTHQFTLHNGIQIAVKCYMDLKFSVPQSSSPLNPCG